MENYEILKALVLGIVEGLTEFLPISSTGHLILFGHMIDFNSDDGRVFEVVIQLGAILAVCWLYRVKIIELLKGLLSGDNEARHFAKSVILALNLFHKSKNAHFFVHYSSCKIYAFQA